MSMDLIIDGQVLQTDSAWRGMGRYSRNLLGALVRARPRWRMAVVQNELLQPADPAWLAGLPVLPMRPPLADHPQHSRQSAGNEERDRQGPQGCSLDAADERARDQHPQRE